ncbi:hypothetical protein BN159_3349 [Streptomyces davaonensis JCM 4913]|uniref:DUF1707 domain-containing protein n=1 Tax=Streptomyces davaonensis (strain DSM 101723 / JCM 4913 / KCC S-0913 / 768) TaxID=1214101 RepID=K4R307_STRDJ|nr:DUF1707 domain-containing protein [Streptomyces davaonensis]CCK27728.1 hypothetical protein BN159_3349 [Streptomyces davaonensis JCM 4913]
MDLEKQTAPAAATELRASDADRDRIADILREALAEGRLTADEHSERVEGVLNAKTVGELEVFIQDLPAAHTRRTTPSYASAPSRPTGLPAEPDDTAVAIFSSAVRKGRWRAGRRIHAYAIFGSVEIDLSEALFEYQQVVIKAFAVFGSVEVRVPENVTLRGAGGGVLGSFEVDTLDAEDPAAPVVYLDGWAVLGSVEGRPRRGKLVADILDRVHAKVEKGLRKHLDR